MQGDHWIMIANFRKKSKLAESLSQKNVQFLQATVQADDARFTTIPSQRL